MANIENVLKDSNTKVENIGLLLRKEGIIVKLHFAGGKNSYTISHKAFGVRNSGLSDNSKEFLSAHVRKNTVTVISKKDANRLKAIEAKTKKKLKELSAGVVFDNTYLTKSSFYEFVDYFEKAKKEYMEVRDYLLDNYDEIIDRFKEIVKSSIEDLGAYEAEAEYEKIMSEIPSKDNFKESFKMEMIKTYFPTMSDLDGLDDGIKEALEDEYRELGENLALNSTASIINEIFSSLNSVFTSNKEAGKLHHKIAQKIENLAKKTREKNIFGNGKINELTRKVESLLELDFDSAIQESEILLSEVYIYAKELGLQDKIDISSCPLTRKDMEDIYEMCN